MFFGRGRLVEWSDRSRRSKGLAEAIERRKRQEMHKCEISFNESLNTIDADKRLHW